VSADHTPELRQRLTRELAQRLCWSAMSYSLFATLFALNLARQFRGTGLILSARLAALGGLRTAFAFGVIRGRRVERGGNRMVLTAATLSIVFGIYVAFAVWNVRGEVIPECLLALGVIGITSVSASMFAPAPDLNRLNVCAHLLPIYLWAVFALPRYGWLLGAFVVIHAVSIAQTIRMNGAHIREMFVAQLSLELQSEDLRQARDAADQASSAKMRFLANMSHEIRTPLNGIIGLAEVLDHLDLTQPQRNVLHDIDRSGHHLLSIVNDILDMAKVSAGKLSLEQAPFDLPQLIRDLASPAAALADVRQLVFVLDVANDLPPEVKGDPLRIRQVVSNLLANAVKFTPSGNVGLSVRCSRPGDPRGDWIRFSVSDTGIGLSAEEQEHIFQEFHQVDSSSTRKFGGSGLGLAISHRLAELMGGRLWVESRMEEGSTFYFELPLPATGKAARAKPAVAQLPPLPEGLRVLVAEDNVVNQKVILMMLLQAGVRAEIVDNGSLAVEAHKSAPFDLILMDCQMPVLDGYEATARIRGLSGPASRVPIVGVTANAFAEDRDRCLRAGMNGYVPKPLRRAALLNAMSQAAAMAAPVRATMESREAQTERA